MTRIMYVENKETGEGRIGRVTFNKTMRTIFYRGKTFSRYKGGYKYNHLDENGVHYWISGPKKNGNDRLYGGQKGVSIDKDVWDEYWRDIRGLEIPEYKEKQKSS